MKFLLAVGLVPVCAGAGIALGRVLQASAGADTTWVPLAGGAVCWMGAYLMLPKPMLIYVFGHELTHALWTWAMGGRVKRFKASARGGHVVITKTNFLITLAPYFFPLYALAVAGVYGAMRLVWDTHPYAAVFHLVLGAAYMFHLTLTWHVLQSRQTDVTDQGYLFSSVVVFLGNAAVLLVAIPLLTAKLSVLDALNWWWQGTQHICHQLALLVR